MLSGDFSILVIDDTSTNLESVRAALKNHYKVYTAPTGKRALAFLQKTIPHLILLDIEMSDMNGYNILKILKTERRYSRIPVICMTGREDRDSERIALEEGAMDYIQKPLFHDVLLARIRIHLELYTYREHLEELVSEKTSVLQKTQDTTLEMLGRVIEYRDRETGWHIHRTTLFVRLLIERLQMMHLPGYELSDRYAIDIIRSTKLHDIGKIAVPDSILLKPTQLTDAEFKIIKQHPVYGSEMLSEAIDKLGNDSFFNVAHEICISHHEKWDGTGYPYGLIGEQIPVSGRIMAIADVYDALISQRPYKEAYTYENAFQTLLQGSGTHFDPTLIQAIEKLQDAFEKAARLYQE